MKKTTVIIPLLFGLILMSPASIRAAQDDNPDPLCGLTRFGLVIAYANPYDPAPDKTRAALRDGARAKLIDAGLELLSPAERKAAPGRPVLVILIGVLPHPICGPQNLYEIEITMKEDFTRTRPPMIKEQKPVWKRHVHGLLADPQTQGPEMVDHALYNLDDFIKACLRANTPNP